MWLKGHLQTQVKGWFRLCFCRDFISLKNKTGRRVNAQQWTHTPEHPACRYWGARGPGWNTWEWGSEFVANHTILMFKTPPPHPLIFVFVLFIYLCIYIVCLLFQFELIPLLLTPLYSILFHNWGHPNMLWYFAKTPSLSGLYRVLTYPSRHPGMSMCLDAPLTADVTFHLACGHFSSFSSCWAALQDTNKGYCAWPRE